MELEKLAKNLGLDQEDIRELFELYVETTTTDLAELKGAIEANDAQLAHTRAHSIKGASGNLGLDEMYDLAKQIDDRARVNSLAGLEELTHTLEQKYNRLVIEFKEIDPP
ncbi:MAG: Hpt domain-containing protein [Thermodesulfobacteriota bacterium]|nr:Hpt domain-containing protein [Thermodesulfobacteriota bacterium]